MTIYCADSWAYPEIPLFVSSSTEPLLVSLNAKFNFPEAAKPTDIRMVAYTGEVSSELHVQSETSIYVKMKCDELLKPYENACQALHECRAAAVRQHGPENIDAYLNSLQEYKDLEARSAKKLAFSESLAGLCDSYTLLADYGAIKFHANAEGIVCMRVNQEDAPCDRALIDRELAQIQQTLHAQESDEPDRGHCITV